jgi:hypothetical protein
MAKDKATFYIQKIDGELPRYENPNERQEFLENAPAGRYAEEIKRIPKKGTLKQNAAIFGVAIKNIIVQANDLGIDVSYLLKYLLDGRIPKGQGLTVDFLHELMYIISPTTDEDRKRTTLSNMSTVQKANLYKALQGIFAPIGIVIDDPDPKWFEKQKTIGGGTVPDVQNQRKVER